MVTEVLYTSICYNLVIWSYYLVDVIESQSTLLYTKGSSTIATSTAQANVPYIEQYVAGPFKVWHVAGFVGCGLATILIAICCMIDLRVPRTKEEIEANYEKRQAAHKYIDKLGQMEFTGFQLKSQAAMQKDREKKKKELEEKKKLRKQEVAEAKKKQQTAQQQPPGPNMPMAYHPGYMQGMMGYPPNMMMGNSAGMLGSTTSLQNNQAAGGVGGMMGYPPPAMMYGGGMWRANSMSNIPHGSVPQSPYMTRAMSATNMATAEDSKQNKDTDTKKFSSLVSRLMEAKDERKENNDEDQGEEGKKMEDEENKEKKAPSAAKKKWGKK